MSRLATFALLTGSVVFGFWGCGEGTPQSRSTNEAPAILKESWSAYIDRFIQKDGRVIDYKASAISTSEGQAYAMLRAVWIGDRSTFDRTFSWATNNLNSGIRNDSLWAWKWGQDTGGKWRVLDKAFASDADQDAALALILASMVWKNSGYAEHAHLMLRDLWVQGTVEAGGRRYLLAGDSLCQGNQCRINPSYYAPYAYRVFQEFDRPRPWISLVDSTYQSLQTVSGFADTRLPADWVQFNRETGEIRPSTPKDSAFSYDAFRVYWRVAMDLELFHESRANEYLKQTLPWLTNKWSADHKLPAAISKNGAAMAEYESLEMLSGLLPAVRDATMSQKIDAAYSMGMWGDRNSYYLQNWAWFGAALYHDFVGPFELVRPK